MLLRLQPGRFANDISTHRERLLRQPYPEQTNHTQDREQNYSESDVSEQPPDRAQRVEQAKAPRPTAGTRLGARGRAQCLAAFHYRASALRISAIRCSSSVCSIAPRTSVSCSVASKGPVNTLRTTPSRSMKNVTGNPSRRYSSPTSPSTSITIGNSMP